MQKRLENDSLTGLRMVRRRQRKRYGVFINFIHKNRLGENVIGLFYRGLHIIINRYLRAYIRRYIK